VRNGCFPVGICQKTFINIKFLVQLQYEGPIALCCDDIKLHLSLRPYLDMENDGWHILSTTGKPYWLANVDSF
jgi:hypothetical protein